jgi:prepilin-type processing-associated H-X9-DG protein
LLVVISIISILIAILLPALRAAREQSKTLSCLSKMKQIGLCFTMYQSNYREFFPPAGFTVPTTQNPGGKLYWIDLFKPYVNERTPVANVDNYLWFNNASPNPEVFQCPVLLPTQCNRTAFSGMAYNNYALTDSSVGGLWADAWRRQIDILQPSNICAVVDGNESSPYQGTSGLNTGEKMDFRHSGGATNMLYTDGHCKTIPENSIKVGWSNFYRKYPYMENWK